jgi:glycosyltransferase involved in cell wall biosynthesis
MSKNILKKEMRLEILISTMNRSSLSFLYKMFPDNRLGGYDILIINQTEPGRVLKSELDGIRIINSFEKGLSLSRNLALKNATGDICLIADDDVEYISGFDAEVLSAFSKFKLSSIILFKIATFDSREYKDYTKGSKRLTRRRDIIDSSSIEIAFRRSDIVKNHVNFNTLFGLGSCFSFGEEYLFLKKALKQKLYIYFEDKFIVRHNFERASSNIGSDSFVRAKAALYYIDYRNFGYLVLFKFLIFLLSERLILGRELITKFKLGIKAIRMYKQAILNKN